jgi:kynurenine formamidase
MTQFGSRRWIAVVVAAAVASGVAATITCGQVDRWYPSRWGADDQRGAANRITPAKVMQARELIRQGRIYQLGRVYEAGMPLPATRHYSLHIPQAYVATGSNQGIFHDEVVSADFAQPGGLTRLGIENVGPIFTRGVLIDVAGLKGVAQLAAGYEVTAADIKAALSRQKVQITSGDMVVIHTGWGSLWMKDNAKYLAGAPGIGLAAAQLLADAEVVVVGGDSSAVEVSPNPNASLAAPVHQLLITRNGIYLHENLATEELARDAVYEFAYVFSPLRLKGATGSPGNPIAVR